MMQLKMKLENERRAQGVKWEIVEQDYVLSWVLQGMSLVPDLKESLVFKGGTALKKSYFGDYRFSQDLDYSVINPSALENQLNELMIFSCKKATEEIQSQGENVEFKVDPYMERRPHPEGQKAYMIQARLPWHRDFYTTVYVEITFREKVLLKPKLRGIIHPYGETLTGQLNVYPLEEVIAEKMRALIQFSKKLHERGWGRSRVRDYYDLWRILKDYREDLDLKIIPELAKEKCAYKDIVFKGYQDIFDDRLTENINQEWDTWLSNIMKDVPERDKTIAELKDYLAEVFS